VPSRVHNLLLISLHGCLLYAALWKKHSGYRYVLKDFRNKSLLVTFVMISTQRCCNQATF